MVPDSQVIGCPPMIGYWLFQANEVGKGCWLLQSISMKACGYSIRLLTNIL